MTTINPISRREDVGIPIPPEVRDVCAERALSAFLPTAIRLAKAAFVDAQKLWFEVDSDPDTGKRRIVLNVTADAPANQLAERYGYLNAEWVCALPSQAREWLRLSVHTLRDE